MSLFADRRLRVVWTALRVWLGVQWLEAGWHKVLDPAWMVTGESVRGYWTFVSGALPNSKPLIKYAWYQSYIEWLLATNQHVWMAKLVAVGEVLVGVGLIVGGFTVAAALFGALMNLNYMLAGTASTNPVLYTIAILIVVAGPAAHYWGVDRFILPRLSGALQGLGNQIRPPRSAPSGA